MTLSLDKRYEIVFLSQHPMGPRLGAKAVANVVKCAKSTVQYWLNRWNESKDLTDFTRSGRPRVTTKKVDKRIEDLAGKNKIVTTRDIQSVLKRQSVHISQETVRRRLKEAGARFLPPMSKPLLTEKHRQDRFRWAQVTSDIDWDKIIFSDETTLRLNQVKRYAWNLPGQRKVIRTVKNAVKVNVWGCFSSNGFGRIWCFRENLNAKLLCTIYKHNLLPTARNQFGLKSNSWKLQEDNDPKHTSKLATEWRSKYGVQKIDWPSMSPDLNPIENVWKLLKMNVAKRKIRTYKSLVAAIKKEWKALPMELASALVQSMKNRVYNVIENDGDFILY